MYEHANEFSGYGASVDLLEDCPDLSVYGFDKIRVSKHHHIRRTLPKRHAAGTDEYDHRMDSDGLACHRCQLLRDPLRLVAGVAQMIGLLPVDK